MEEWVTNVSKQISKSHQPLQRSTILRIDTGRRGDEGSGRQRGTRGNIVAGAAVPGAPRKRGKGLGVDTDDETDEDDRGGVMIMFEDEATQPPNKKRRDPVDEAVNNAKRWQELRPEILRRSVESTTAVWDGPLGRRLYSEAEFTEACKCTVCPVCDYGPVDAPIGHARVEYLTATGVSLISVPIYRCELCSTQFHQHPVDVNAFPATPTRSTALTVNSSAAADAAAACWIDMRLLERYFILQYNNPQMSELDICQTLTSPSVHGPDLDSDQQIPLERLQKYLGEALPEYLVVRAALQDPTTLGCPDYPTRRTRLAVCSACGLSGPDRRLHSVHFDACMKLKAQEHAARTQNAAVPVSMLNWRIMPVTSEKPLVAAAPNITGTRAWCAELDELMGHVRPTGPCADERDFAAAENGKGKAANPALSERGLFGAVCSHGFILLAAVMPEGERYAFAVMCLVVLAKEQGCKIANAWYDIACRFFPYLRRYIQRLIEERHPDAELLKKCLGETQTPLPTMHELMHILACRIDFSSRNIKGAGTGVGDIVESVWAHFGKYGKRHSLMSSAKRLTLTTANIEQWNLTKDAKLAELVVKLFCNGLLKLDAAEAMRSEFLSEIPNIEEKILRDAFDRREARARGAAAAAAAPLSDAERLAENILREAIAEGSTVANGIPSQLYHVGTGRALATGVLLIPGKTKKLESLKKEIEKLRATVTGDWEPLGTAFRVHVAALRIAKRLQLRAQIEKVQQEFRFFDGLFTREGNDIGQERGKALRRLKEARKKQLSGLLSVHSGWNKGGFAGLDDLTFSAPEPTVESVTRGTALPWDADVRHAAALPAALGGTSREAARSVEGLDAQTAGVEALGCELVKFDRLIERAKEELELRLQDVEAVKIQHERRVASVAAAIQRQTAEQQRLDAEIRDHPVLVPASGDGDDDKALRLQQGQALAKLKRQRDMTDGMLRRLQRKLKEDKQLQQAALGRFEKMAEEYESGELRKQMRSKRMRVLAKLSQGPPGGGAAGAGGGAPSANTAPSSTTGGFVGTSSGDGVHGAGAGAGDGAVVGPRAAGGDGGSGDGAGGGEGEEEEDDEDAATLAVLQEQEMRVDEEAEDDVGGGAGTILIVEDEEEGEEEGGGGGGGAEDGRAAIVNDAPADEPAAGLAIAGAAAGYCC